MSIIDKIQTKLQNADLPGSICIELDDLKVSVDADGNLLNDHSNAECTLSLNEEVLKSIMDGSIDPMKAYFGGDLKIKGDMGIAMSLSKILKK